MFALMTWDRRQVDITRDDPTRLATSASQLIVVDLAVK
jgi:hypothetical protein